MCSSAAGSTVTGMDAGASTMGVPSQLHESKGPNAQKRQLGLGCPPALQPRPPLGSWRVGSVHDGEK